MPAARSRQRDSARFLIKHGAKVDPKDPIGWTALHTAAIEEQEIEADIRNASSVRKATPTSATAKPVSTRIQ